MKLIIPNWSKWQKATGKAVKWRSLSVDLFVDPKIQQVLSDCPDALLCLQWLWLHADANGTLDLNARHLSATWRGLFGNSSPRWDFDRRMELLAAAGLVEIDDPQPAFETTSNDVQTTFKTDTNDVQTAFKTDTNDVQTAFKTDTNALQTAFELPQTHGALRAIQITNTINPNGLIQITQTDAPNGAGVWADFKFSELGEQGAAYANTQAQPLKDSGFVVDFHWPRGWLSSFVPPPEAHPDVGLHLLELWKEALDAGLSQRKYNPVWFQKVFKQKVLDWLPPVRGIGSPSGKNPVATIVPAEGRNAGRLTF